MAMTAAVTSQGMPRSMCATVSCCVVRTAESSKTACWSPRAVSNLKASNSGEEDEKLFLKSFRKLHEPNPQKFSSHIRSPHSFFSGNRKSLKSISFSRKASQNDEGYKPSSSSTPFSSQDSSSPSPNENDKENSPFLTNKINETSVDKSINEPRDIWNSGQEPEGLKGGFSEDYSNNGSGIPHVFITSVAIIGALETAYLTYEKLFGGSVVCPVGGSCNGVLDSPWGTLLGLPLSLFGFLSYCGTALLTQADRVTSTNTEKNTFTEKITGNNSVPKNLLLGLTSIMAATSAYLIYILNTELEGFSCVYCYLSALLSSTLFLLTLKGFSLKDLRKAIVPQLGFTALVVSAYALSVTVTDVRSAYAGSNEIDLPPIEPEISTVSTEISVSLAKHLKSIGAKMYGAFWCSHCYEQKQMFGQQAMKIVEYVECYPEGYRRGVKIAEACVDANIEGFPTWVVNGQILSGEQDLEQLAQASNFDVSKYLK